MLDRTGTQHGWLGALSCEHCPPCRAIDKFVFFPNYLGRAPPSHNFQLHISRRCPSAGVVVSSLVIARAALRAAHGGGTQVTGVQVDRMELDFPSLSRPLSVRIVGVRVWLQQQKLPEVSGA